MEICFSYRCAGTQHQCTAARVRAKCSPHCSVLLCKTGSQQAVCYCIYAYGILLFKQACSAATPMHCSTGQGKMHSPLFSAALQNRLTACSASLQLQLLRFALHTGVQCCNTNALQHWSGQKSFPAFCAALQNRLTACLCHCEYTYGGLFFMQACSAATPMHCSTGQGKIDSPLLSAAL